MNFRAAVAALAAACFILPACAPRLAANACGSPEQFRDEFVTKLRAAYPGAKVAVRGPLEVHLTLAGKSEGQTAFLDNVFVDCGRDPALKAELLDNFVRSAGADPQAALAAPLDVRQARLVSVIRPAALELQARREGAPLISRPFAGEMVEVLAEKPPRLLAFVDRTGIDEFKLSEADLWSRARSNIPTVISGVKVEALGPGLYWVTAESQDAPSLILAEGFWANRVTAATGQPVVFFSDREHFIYADSANPRAVEGLRRMVAGDDGNAMSLRLYRRSADGRWTME